MRKIFGNKRQEKEIAISPAQEWALSISGDGTEHPDELSHPSSHIHPIERTFCFVDIAGFTLYTRKNGPAKALELLDQFRNLTREVASARGIRIAKWLGDGVLLVSINPGACIASAAHLAISFEQVGIQMRIGIATGKALFLDGDDYVGEPVNLAAKLCSSAETGQILACINKEEIPEWVSLVDEISVPVRDIGRLGNIHILKPDLMPSTGL